MADVGDKKKTYLGPFKGDVKYSADGDGMIFLRAGRCWEAQTEIGDLDLELLSF